MIHVLRTEWLVNLPLVDINTFFVALERNCPIFVLFHGAGFRRQIARKNGLSGDLEFFVLEYVYLRVVVI